VSTVLERIEDGSGKLLAVVVRRASAPAATTFVTESDATLQVGFVVYPEGGAVAKHSHTPITRTITGMSEVLLVRSGRCIVDVYDDDRSLVGSRELDAGDVLLLMAGGHGFRMLEDTVLLEVKQGPYAGVDEKERF
jgi:hypothetical protein